MYGYYSSDSSLSSRQRLRIFSFKLSGIAINSISPISSEMPRDCSLTSQRSGINSGVMRACWDAAGEVIKTWATEGHSVAIPGLGTMRFGLRAKSVDKVEDVKAGLITTRRIIFTPTVAVKDELANTAIQITCIDRYGKEVKRVTSTYPGTIEDPENQNQGSNTS